MWVPMISVLFGWMVIDFIYNLHFKNLNKEVANLKNELKLEANGHALSVQTGQESLDKLQRRYDNLDDSYKALEEIYIAQATELGETLAKLHVLANKKPKKKKK